MLRRPKRIFANMVLALGLCSSDSCRAEYLTLSHGLIGHWKFEDTTGPAVPDLSGHGNDGLIIPTLATSFIKSSGSFAGTLSFSGTSDRFVRVTPTPTLNGLRDQITVAALIYPVALWTPPTLFRRGSWKLQRIWNSTVDYVQPLFGVTLEGAKFAPAPTGFAAIIQRQWRETLHPDQFFIGYGLRNNLQHYKWHIALMDGSELSLYSLPQGEQQPQAAAWIHLAGTYDGVSGLMSLYVNGKLIGSLIHPGEIRLDSESMSRPITIGAELNESAIDKGRGEFDGFLRDVRIYNRALSADEISLLAANTDVRLAQ